MPLPGASYLFRRLQNCFYLVRSSPEVEETVNIYATADISSPMSDIPLERAFGRIELTSASVASGLTMSSSLSGDLLMPMLSSSSSPLSSHPSSPSDPPSSRAMQDTDARRRSSSNSKISSSPDADAQTLLRRRILEIQSLNLPEYEKALRVQGLMSQAYLDAQQRQRGPDSRQLNQGDLTEEDLRKTYHDKAHGILGCKHYRRAAKLQCSTCNHWATCRYCHDEKEDHKLIRRDIRNMICMHCSTPQKAAQYCQICHIRLARYYCDKCHLWDDSPTKSIYHCGDCGICRVGEGLGKDFFHCKTCNVCMSMSLQGSHRCIERNTECDCPICGEYLFTSPETVVFMPCGHSIHQRSYRCPTCSRALVNMDHYFRLLDIEVRRQPMPSPYNSWQTVILCNDCSAKSTVSFHFVGHKCNLCSSYNTVIRDILKPEQNPTVQSRSSDTEIISAESTTAAAIMETSTFRDPSASAFPDRSYSD